VIGRARELAALSGCWQAALAGQGGVALVVGEPGIGKMRLLAELGRRAAESGGLVIRGGASDAEGMPPYLPFVEALGDYVRAADAGELASDAGDRAILATILSELVERLGAPMVGYPLPPEQTRLRLFDAVATLSEQPSAGTGTVMRPDTPRRYAEEAGYRGVEVLPIEHGFFRLYRLLP
jgi:hypothetical protein